MSAQAILAQVVEGRACRANNERGEPCSAPPMAESDYCFHHDPAKASERAKARKRGGYNRRQVKSSEDAGPVRIRSTQDVVALVERAIADTVALENSIARNRAIGYLAGVALKAQEVGELEERLEAVEKALLEGGPRPVPLGEIPLVRGAVG